MDIYKYEIDYEYGKALFFTTESDKQKGIGDFLDKSGDCFGIRKSIGKVSVVDISKVGSKFGAALYHNGDSVLWNEMGEKIKSEFDD